MQTRDPKTRTVPPIESREQWDELVKTIETEGDAIIESEGGRKVAVISYNEFQEYQEARRNRLREEALARLQVLEEQQARRTEDVSEEEIERISVEAGREIRKALNEKYRAGLIDLPEREAE